MSTASSSTQSRSSRLWMPRPQVWQLLLISAPVICLAVYYTPLLVSLGWHATHGMSVNYRGLRVRVPFGWTAVPPAAEDDYPDNPQGITIERQPMTFAFTSEGPETMYFNLLLPDPKATSSEQVAQWQNLFRQAHSDSGFEVSPAAGAPSGMDCLKATPRDGQSVAALACVSSTGGWFAQFAGSDAHVPLFLQIAAALNSKS